MQAAEAAGESAAPGHCLLPKRLKIDGFPGPRFSLRSAGARVPAMRIAPPLLHLGIHQEVRLGLRFFGGAAASSASADVMVGRRGARPRLLLASTTRRIRRMKSSRSFELSGLRSEEH